MGNKERSSKYYYAHLEGCRKRAREYQAKQRALRGPGRKRNEKELRYHRDYMRTYAETHPEYSERQNKLRYMRDCKDRPSTRKRIRTWKNKHRLEVLAILGNKCACCGDTTPEFLSVDHKNGGGAEHRKQYVGKRAEFWRSILNDPNMKEKYQALCMNCNWAKGIHGYCPHERQLFVVEVAC